MSPILTNMVTQLLKKKPQDPVPHMVQFLEELQGVATPALTAEELVQLEQLRIKHEKLKKQAMSGAVGAGGAQAAAA